MKPKVAIFICSCDRYSDLWPTVASSFQMYWPNCPYDIYIHSNEIKDFEIDHERMKIISTGPDLDWSSNLITAIESLQDDYLLMWIDDVFLRGHVETRKLQDFIEFMLINNADALKLRRHPKVQHYNRNKIGCVPSNTPYRLTVFGVIWKRASLLRALKKGESPWEFEIKGSYRNDGFNVFTLSYDFFSIFHGVVKGLWLRGLKKQLYERGYKIESSRLEMTIFQSLRNNLANTRAFIFHSLPYKLRNRIIAARWESNFDK